MKIKVLIGKKYCVFYWPLTLLRVCSSKKAWARLEVCLGSLSCIKRWFGKVSLMNGIIVFKNVAIQIGVHYSLENTDFRGATPADASPNMNLTWVFRFWLSLPWFINLSITRAAKLLKRDGAFVGEDDIECISRVGRTRVS